jgi:tetratricopeptide (TPR) repeat protein
MAGQDSEHLRVMLTPEAFAAEDLKQAETLFKQALTVDPELAEDDLNLSAIHYRKKDYVAAAKEARKAAALFERSQASVGKGIDWHQDASTAYMNLGMITFNQANEAADLPNPDYAVLLRFAKEAQTSFIRAITLNPANQQARDNLKSAQDYEKALRDDMPAK